MNFEVFGDNAKALHKGEFLKVEEKFTREGREVVKLATRKSWSQSAVLRAIEFYYGVLSDDDQKDLIQKIDEMEAL